MRRLGGRSSSPPPRSLLVSDSPRMVHSGRGATQGGLTGLKKLGYTPVKHAIARLQETTLRGARDV